MKIKINDNVSVRLIDETWNCCKYKYRVFLDVVGASCCYYNEIEATLKEWFGEAQYFWDDMWLCELKPECENINHLYNK